MHSREDAGIVFMLGQGELGLKAISCDVSFARKKFHPVLLLLYALVNLQWKHCFYLQ